MFLCIIYSSFELQDILKTVHSYSLNKKEVGPIRNDYKRNAINLNYIKSNRKILLIKKSLFERLQKNGLTQENNYDFKISLYQIRKDNYPPEDSLFHIFYPVSDKNTEIIILKIKYFEIIGFLTANNFKIQNGIIFFEDKVDFKIRIVIKIIIDDVEDGFRVSWCKKKYFEKNFKI
jgi:hypothetical protein